MKSKSYKKNITIEEPLKKRIIEENEYLETMFNKIDKKIKLDNEQKQIILANDENIMVIAGAGSGKTTTICAKVNYLIERQNIKDEEIMVISFTNKTVQELEDRINKDFKHNVKIKTFHKLAYEIIKETRNNPPKIIKDENIIIKQCLKKLYNKNSENAKQILDLYNYLFKIRNNKFKTKILKKIKHYVSLINKKTNDLSITPKTIDELKNNKNKYEEQVKYEELVKFFKRFISLIKSRNIKLENINQKLKYKKNITSILNFIIKFYNYYQQELNKTNQIDFNDMINMANDIIITTHKKLKYKYIIVDEYQDISESRLNIIKNISENSHNKTMVVGDDWQCIYSFAASNINIFINYKDNFKNCKIYKITKTYRNSQELIDVAGKFIQKNSNQIKKKLISTKKNTSPIIILKYKNNKIIDSLIQSLNYIISKYGQNKKILLLGRYNFDIKSIIDNKNFKVNNNKIIYKNNKQIDIEFMTIHSAKGLGYDNVIIINAKNQTLGFPSKIKTEPLLKRLIYEENTIKYAEERRLFYVALTRTKNEVIILTPKSNQSIFIKEIQKYKNVITKSNISKKKLIRIIR